MCTALCAFLLKTQGASDHSLSLSLLYKDLAMSHLRLSLSLALFLSLFLYVPLPWLHKLECHSQRKSLSLAVFSAKRIDYMLLHIYVYLQAKQQCGAWSKFWENEAYFHMSGGNNFWPQHIKTCDT